MRLAMLFATSVSLMLTGCAQVAGAAAAPREASAIAAQAAGPAMTFVADQDYLSAVEQLLAQPNLRSVDVLQFSFAIKPGATQRIFDRLVALQAAGTRVRVLLEGVAGTRGENAKTMARLVQAGIKDVRLSKTHTTHAKAICVNGRSLLTGSTNWTVTSIERNNETNALIHSEALGAAFTGWYERMWGGHEAMMPAITRDGDTAFLTDTAFYAAAEALIREAETSLDIATYFLAYRADNRHDAKVEALLRLIVERVKAQKARGKTLRVRFFLDNNGIDAARQQSHTQDAACHARAFLAAHGVTEVAFDSVRQISHMKFIIRDGAEVLFGSTNWYWHDLDDHHQINIRTTDAALVSRFAGYMAAKLSQAGPMPCQSPG